MTFNHYSSSLTLILNQEKKIHTISINITSLIHTYIHSIIDSYIHTDVCIPIKYPQNPQNRDSTKNMQKQPFSGVPPKTRFSPFWPILTHFELDPIFRHFHTTPLDTYPHFNGFHRLHRIPTIESHLPNIPPVQTGQNTHFSIQFTQYTEYTPKLGRVYTPKLGRVYTPTHKYTPGTPRITHLNK